MAISAVFFLIRSESRAPCQREVKKRLPVKVHRWQSQDQRFQRRRNLSTWCHATREARRKILRKTWDIRSIQGNDKGPNIQKPSVLKRSDRGKLKVQIPGNSLSRRIFKLYYHTETCTDSHSKNRVSKYEVHKPSIHDDDISFPTKKLGSTAGYSTFSIEALKTNVLIW